MCEKGKRAAGGKRKDIWFILTWKGPYTCRARDGLFWRSCNGFAATGFIWDLLVTEYTAALQGSVAAKSLWPQSSSDYATQLSPMLSQSTLFSFLPVTASILKCKVASWKQGLNNSCLLELCIEYLKTKWVSLASVCLVCPLGLYLGVIWLVLINQKLGFFHIVLWIVLI